MELQQFKAQQHRVHIFGAFCIFKSDKWMPTIQIYNEALLA